MSHTDDVFGPNHYRLRFMTEEALAKQSGFEIISEPEQRNAMDVTNPLDRFLHDCIETVRARFPAIDKQKVFDALERLHPTDTIKALATGLNIAISETTEKYKTLKDRRYGPLAPAAFGIHVKMMLLDHFGDDFAFPTFPPTLEQDILDHFEESFNAFTTAQRLIEKYTPKLPCEMRDHIPAPGVYVAYALDDGGDWIMERPLFYANHNNPVRGRKYFGPLPHPQMGDKI